MKYEAIRKTVLEAILEAVEKGLINGTSGNIAMRDSEDRNIVAITPSGISYTGMKPEDIAIVERKEDGTNEWIDGNYKPSSEVPMNTEVMRRRPDVNATVHTHSMYATICAMGENPELKPITPPQCEFTPVEIVSFTMPGSNDVAAKVADMRGSSVLRKAFLPGESHLLRPAHLCLPEFSLSRWNRYASHENISGFPYIYQL